MSKRYNYRGKHPLHTSRTLVTSAQSDDSGDWTDTDTHPDEEQDEDINLTQDDVVRILVDTTRTDDPPNGGAERRDDTLIQTAHRVVRDVRQDLT